MTELGEWIENHKLELYDEFITTNNLEDEFETFCDSKFGEMIENEED